MSGGIFVMMTVWLPVVVFGIGALVVVKYMEKTGKYKCMED